jgi:Chitin binding Peritrophin-A domain
LTASNITAIDSCNAPKCAYQYFSAMIPCPNNCSLYLKCVNQRPGSDPWEWIVLDCPPGTQFDNKNRSCVMPADATCQQPCDSPSIGFAPEVCVTPVFTTGNVLLSLPCVVVLSYRLKIFVRWKRQCIRIKCVFQKLKQRHETRNTHLCETIFIATWWR